MGGLVTTDKRASFVRVLAHSGMPVYAAEKAGYSAPDQEAARLLSEPRIVEAVRQERQRLIDTRLAGLGYAALVDLLDSDRTPAAVRFQAAKFAVELGGHTAQAERFDDSKALSDMTLAELAAFVRRGDETLSRMRAISAPVTIDATPEQAEGLKVADLLA